MIHIEQEQTIADAIVETSPKLGTFDIAYDINKETLT